MADRPVGGFGGFGGLFGDNCEILFFILVFLCLFYGGGFGFGHGYGVYKT